MFTIEQIKTAHGKVKSGADFPAYIQEMKGLGVRSYEHFVADGHIQYYGADGFLLTAAPKWETQNIGITASNENLQHALTIHQQGQTTYLVFCKQAADAGVNKWVVDMVKMNCSYYDTAGNEMLVESIPLP